MATNKPIPWVLVSCLLALGAGPSLGAASYFTVHPANAYVGPEGGIAQTAGGNLGGTINPDDPTPVFTPIQSPNGQIVLQQSCLAPSVVAFPEGSADGYQRQLEMAQTKLLEATTYKNDQDGSTVPWDLRFNGVIQIIDGAAWPDCTGCDPTANFSESIVAGAAESYRVAIRANPYRTEAHLGLISTYTERMLAFIFAGNNAAQYASALRLEGGTIEQEVDYWENAIGQYQTAGDLFANGVGQLPDGATLRSSLFATAAGEVVGLLARGLTYEAEAVQYWLQLKYFSEYHDRTSTAYHPQPLLSLLQPKLEHLEVLLLVASDFTHVPRYVRLDFPSVHATLSHLRKQQSVSIPLGMISFAGQRAADNPGEVIGEYAPEYVPFLYKDSPSFPPTSFENLLDQAAGMIQSSKEADGIARQTKRDFDRNLNELILRLDEITQSYNTQLGDLCGWIYGPDQELHPDVIGCLLTPGDREAERTFADGESVGKIYLQYLAISQANLELVAAQQDRHNIYLKAVNAKTVGELMAEQSENLATMYLTNGESLAALETLRGRETARIARETAHKQAEEARAQQRNNMWKSITAPVALLGAGALTLIFPPAGVATAASIIGGAGLAAGGVEGLVNIWGDTANAHGSIALMYETGELQAELAEINAHIDAQKESIRAAESAAVQFAQRNAALWKTEEAWQAAMLDYERAALNVLMAEQRLLMQTAELGNLHTRVAYLLQEMRKAIVLNAQTTNPLARPDYRLWMDYASRYATDAFLRAQEWLYLAAKAASYKVNSSANVSDINSRIEAILKARRGSDLDTIKNQLASDLNSLYLAQGTPTTALPIPLRIRNYVIQNNAVVYNAEGEVVPELSLFETQLDGSNSQSASDAAWLEFLQAHMIFDPGTGSVRLEIPFSSSLHQPISPTGPGYDPLKIRINPLFSPTRYSDLISYEPGSDAAFGVRINVRGRSLSLDTTQSVVARLRQEGTSYLRTDRWDLSPNAVRTWNLQPVDGLVRCSINGFPGSLSTPQFHERSAANDRWILVIDNLEGAGGNNAALLSQLQHITDLEVSFSIKGFSN